MENKTEKTEKNIPKTPKINKKILQSFLSVQTYKIIQTIFTKIKEV